ncbi:MAG: ABC transporter substrate-binding protein [Candidatus Taylorbacteria bacterium]|nr:ABC transporter substrate-binding protein [Candidatus Taylorbacteria bacterium]
MNKKLVWTVVIIIVIVLIVILGLRSKQQITSSETIKIGAILPLTGVQAQVGEGLKNALSLGVQEYKGDLKFELIFEDCALDPKTAVSVASKLINIDKVDVIVDAYAPIGNAVSPLTEKAKVPHLDIAFDPNIAKGDYNFIHFTPPSSVSELFIKELIKRNINKVAVLRVNNQGIQSVFDEFKRQVASTSIKIVGDEVFQPGERDFRSRIANLKQTRPQLYVLLSISPELEIAMEQLKSLAINNVSTMVYFELSPKRELFNDLWFVGTQLPMAGFVERYETVFKKPITFAVPNMYDIFNLIAYATEHAQTKNREGIKDELLKITSFNGVLGNLLVNPEGIVISGAQLKIIRNGKIEVLDE